MFLDVSLTTGRLLLLCQCVWLLRSGCSQQYSLQIPEVVFAGQGSPPEDFIKLIPEGAARPFLALKDPDNAAGQDIQRLYEQIASISSISYLLFAAAEPLSKAQGSTMALLPYLSPTVLRLYAAHPERCSSDLIKRLYDLSNTLYGRDSMKACHYDLYTSLRSTFSWVRDNIALRQQEVPGQPLASAMWPDMTKYPAQKLTAVVAAALTDQAKLGQTALLVNASCGLAVKDFAALVPDVAAVLKDLHADLLLLEQLGKNLLDNRWSEVADVSGGGDDAAADATADSGRRRQRRRLATASSTTTTASSSSSSSTASLGGSATGDDTYFYSMPPEGFVPAPAATLPPVLLPLLFHIMLYVDRGATIAPTQYTQAPAYVERLVRVANTMARPTNIQLFAKEVRNDPMTYPYLLLPNRVAWLTCPSGGAFADQCLQNQTFLASAVADFPRAINVFIVSDTTVMTNYPLGYSWTPGSDVIPKCGFVFMTWDGLSTSGSNSLALYNDGPNTLLHETFHHLGIKHTFTAAAGSSTGANQGSGCVDADYVIDTPTTLGTIGSSSFAATATAYCMELFWGQYGGDWDATYTRWSSTLGIPVTDMNAWADSCPGNPGYDELGNYMTYNTPVCFAALGHFTAGQAQRAHYITSELNPILYAWGQYYAAAAAAATTQLSVGSASPPDVYDNNCTTTRRGCPCKSSWSLNGTSYSFCDRVFNNDTLICEVLNATACASCTTLASKTTCLAPCAGTPVMCKKPPAPG
ncbi:hypothetical protein Vretifemale_9532, partial [Volvox reticuliferus]